MFNRQVLDYTAYIETVFHSLPNVNKQIRMNGCQGLCYWSRQLIISYHFKTQNTFPINGMIILKSAQTTF